MALEIKDNCNKQLRETNKIKTVICLTEKCVIIKLIFRVKLCLFIQLLHFTAEENMPQRDMLINFLYIFLYAFREA